jgi:hypothetical protein
LSLVQKRYFPRFSLLCLAVAGRPKYSTTNEPLGMRSCVKSPLPLCDRRTVSRKDAGINHRSSRKDALLRNPCGEPITIPIQPRPLAQFNRRQPLHSYGKSMPTARLGWFRQRPMSATGIRWIRKFSSRLAGEKNANTRERVTHV